MYEYIQELYRKSGNIWGKLEMEKWEARLSRIQQFVMQILSD